MRAEPIFDLVRLSASERFLPSCQGTCLVVGVEHPVPALPVRASQRRPGELVPSVVVEVVKAVWSRRPDHLRDGVKAKPELPFALTPRRFLAGPPAGVAGQDRE